MLVLENISYTADDKEILKDIIERDERDMNRSTSPLKQAEDACLVDSSDLTIEEVTEEILEICRRKRGEEASCR